MTYQIKKKPLRVDSAAVYAVDPKIGDDPVLRKKFSLVDRFEEPYELFRVQDGEFWLPRNVASVNGVDNRDVGIQYLSDGFENNFVPRNSEQQRVVDESVDLLLKEDQDHILMAPTGFGKTYLGCAIAARLQVRTLVITTKEDIIEQWAKAAKEVLGVGVGVWRGDKYPLLPQQFVVGLVQSVRKGPTRYPPVAYKRFGLVICDEVHRMGAEAFSQAMWWLPAKHRLGLSATPYRKDGRDGVFKSHIGPVMVKTEMETMIPKVLVKYTGWKVPKRMRYGVIERIPHSAGKLGLLTKIMGQDLPRNQLIVSFLVSCLRKGRQTIVFADTIAHLETLYEMLEYECTAVHDVGFYVGLPWYEGKRAEKKAEREAAKYKPIILATFAMASEATDIPWLDACVLATPRSDVKQIVGRIRREYPDKKQPVVLDLVDDDSPVLKAYANKRRSWYRSLGCEVTLI